MKDHLRTREELKSGRQVHSHRRPRVRAVEEGQKDEIFVIEKSSFEAIVGIWSGWPFSTTTRNTVKYPADARPDQRGREHDPHVVDTQANCDRKPFMNCIRLFGALLLISMTGCGDVLPKTPLGNNKGENSESAPPKGELHDRHPNANADPVDRDSNARPVNVDPELNRLREELAQLKEDLRTRPVDKVENVPSTPDSPITSQPGETDSSRTGNVDPPDYQDPDPGSPAIPQPRSGGTDSLRIGNVDPQHYKDPDPSSPAVPQSGGPDSIGATTMGKPQNEVEKASMAVAGFDTTPFSKWLLTVTTDGGNASGFIALADGKSIIVTNCHVLGGGRLLSIKLMNSDDVPMSESIDIIRGRDIAIVHSDSDLGGLKLMEDVAQRVKSGDKVAVLGNSMGKGVVTAVEGVVMAVGPELVEINAEFVSGNSGSPIVHIDSGEVIGVASYTTTEGDLKLLRDQNSAFTKTRRFGYRIDNRTDVEKIPSSMFSQSAAIVKKIDGLTDRLVLFYVDAVSDNSLDNAHLYAKQERDGLSRAVNEFLTKTGRGNLSAADFAKERVSMMRALQSVCKSDLLDAAFRKHPFDSWHLQEVRRIQSLRKEIFEEFIRLESVYSDRKF